jgi:uncharacterized protein (DUF1015 family)
MAKVYPFQGFRYNGDIVKDLSRVVTQPYDKTTPSMQDEYYQRSPYNVVRITMNREKGKDPRTNYGEAGEAFRQWIEQDVLIQDDTPAFYAYYQKYEMDGRRKLQKGIIALLDLHNSESGVLPHEHTLSAPKEDRLQLLRSIEGNEDLIYMLYADDTLSVDRIMDESISDKQPLIEVADDFGTVHSIWGITNPEAANGIANAMRSQKLFIADGHHRFETSVNFMNECKEKKWTPAATESFDKRMVSCFNIAAGVTILPTHRLVRDLPAFDARSFLSNIGRHFIIEPFPSIQDLWKEMRERRKDHVFGLYTENIKEFHLLRLKPQAFEDPRLLKSAEAFRKLDVSILHSLILEQHFGIDEGKLAAQAHIDYAPERDSCIRMVNEGRYQAAFFLNPTTAEQIQRIASLGERMPQKSTDFYPKLLTGLIFMKMKIQKE